METTPVRALLNRVERLERRLNLNQNLESDEISVLQRWKRIQQQWAQLQPLWNSSPSSQADWAWLLKSNHPASIETKLALILASGDRLQLLFQQLREAQRILNQQSDLLQSRWPSMDWETLYQVRDELNRVKLLQNQQQARLTKLLTLHYEQAQCLSNLFLHLSLKQAPS